MGGVPQTGPAFDHSLPLDAIDVVVVASELPGSASVWVGTYVSRLIAGTTVWISLGAELDKLYVVGWPRPLPEFANLRQAIHYLGRSDLISAWVIGWHRYPSPIKLLAARPDCITILCGAGEMQEQDAIWFAGELAAAADQSAPLK